MAVNLIVVAVTLTMGGFVAVWLICPRCRSWFEAPKQQPLSWEQPRRPSKGAHLLSIALMASAGLSVASAGPSNEVQLFNGKNLDGWVAEGVKEFVKNGQALPVWSVKNGKLVCTGKGFGFLRYDRRKFADFVLHVEFRMGPGCNSGLGIRTRSFDPAQSRATRPSFFGYEIQLFDDAGKPPTVHSSGSLYRYVAPRKNAMLPAGEWNSIDIECAGPRIKVTLNGEPIVDVDQQTRQELRQKPLSGFISLQNHGGNIEFRSLRAREIRPSPENAHAPATRGPSDNQTREAAPSS